MIEASASLCPLHPTEPSVATCSRCGRFLCARCVRYPTPPLCEDCFPKFTDPLGILSAPFGVGTALRNGTRMLVPVLGPVMLLTLIFAIPGGLMSLATASSGEPTMRETLKELRVNNLFDSLVGIVCNVACLVLFIGVAEGRKLTILQALAEASARYGRVFGSRLRGGLWIGLFFLALVVPGIWKAVMLAFSTDAAVRISKDDPLEQSSFLVRERWWPVFGGLAVVWSVAYLPTLFVISAGGAALELAGFVQPGWLQGVLAIFEDFLILFSEQFASACSLAMFYALARLTGLTLEPMRWRSGPG